MSSDKTMFSGRIPDELKSLVDADNRPNQEILRVALWREFGGQRQSELQTRLKHKRAQLEELEAERKTLEKSESGLQKEISALQSKIQEYEDDQEGYEDWLDSILDRMEAEEIANLTKSRVEALDGYGEHDAGSEQILSDAERRAAEQERDLLQTRFMPPAEADKVSWGDRKKIADAWGEQNAD